MTTSNSGSGVTSYFSIKKSATGGLVVLTRGGAQLCLSSKF